jgi:transposase
VLASGVGGHGGKGSFITESIAPAFGHSAAWPPADLPSSVRGRKALIGAGVDCGPPTANTFRRGRDFAAWLGLTPLQNSSGGKQRLGKITKMGERGLRRLLIIGASSAAKAAARNGCGSNPWLAQMLSRKPRLLVIVALANKIARTVWALMAHGGIYGAPAAAV